VRLLAQRSWRQYLDLLLEAYGVGSPAHAGVGALSAPQATLAWRPSRQGIFERRIAMADD
jgi:hypothetical protein